MPPLARFYRTIHFVIRGTLHLERFLRKAFFHGPRQLLTSRISSKCAAFIAALSLPSMMFCLLLTVPSLLFQSPQQHAYFYFSKMLNQDPARWLVMVLAAACTIFALAIPAMVPPPSQSARY